jgi:hypothetical protein
VISSPGTEARIERPLYVTLSARAPRLGVLLPLARNVPWQRSCEMALAAQSAMWGGQANLVFPATDDIPDSELFWTLAERFDADYFVSAAFTRRDVGEANPDWLAEWQAGAEEAMDRDIPEASPEVRARAIERELDEIELDARPDDAFAELLERRLAPFHRRRALRYLTPLPVNYRDLRAAASHATILRVRHPRHQLVNARTELGALEQLLLTALVGRLPSGFEAALTESTDIAVNSQVVNDRHQWAQLALGKRDLGAVAVPWTLSTVGLGWYRPWALEEGERVILVTGEAPWDFALYYALLRWRGQVVYWLPQGLAEDTVYTAALGIALRDAARLTEDGRVTVITSSDEEFRDHAVTSLATGEWSMWSVTASAADWRAVVPEQPLRLFESDRPGRAEPVAVHDGATVELPTPIPAVAEDRGPNRLRWVTDVRAHGWAPIRHGTLAMTVLEEPMLDSDHARTGRSGVAYTSTGRLTFGGESLAMSTVRPLLRPVPLLAQLDAALRADGWSCQGSDKGAYAGQSARLFGGFRSLATGRCWTRPFGRSSKRSAIPTRPEGPRPTAVISPSATWSTRWPAIAPAPRTPSTG